MLLNEAIYQIELNPEKSQIAMLSLNDAVRWDIVSVAIAYPLVTSIGFDAMFTTASIGNG